MPDPKLISVQVRRAETVGQRPKYVVTTSVADAGPLPTSRIFVLRIEAPANPLLDHLERIAGIADFEDLTGSREEAVGDGSHIYRSSEFRQEYDSVEVAHIAAKVTKDRVDALVKSWLLYDSEFLGTFDTEHPREDASVIEGLISTYVNIRDQRIEAEKEKAEAEAELNLAETSLTFAAAKCSTLDLLLPVIDQYTSLFENVNDYFGILNTQRLVLGRPPAIQGETDGTGIFEDLNAAIATTSDPDPDPDAVIADNKLQGLRTALFDGGLYDVVRGEMGEVDLGLVNTAALRVACESEKDVAEAEVKVTQQDLFVKSSALEVLEAAEEEALDDVKEACPPFDPSEV